MFQAAQVIEGQRLPFRIAVVGKKVVEEKRLTLGEGKNVIHQLRQVVDIFDLHRGHFFEQFARTVAHGIAERSGADKTWGGFEADIAVCLPIDPAILHRSEGDKAAAVLAFCIAAGHGVFKQFGEEKAQARILGHDENRAGLLSRTGGGGAGSKGLGIGMDPVAGEALAGKVVGSVLTGCSVVGICLPPGYGSLQEKIFFTGNMAADRPRSSAVAQQVVVADRLTIQIGAFGTTGKACRIAQQLAPVFLQELLQLHGIDRASKGRQRLPCDMAAFLRRLLLECVRVVQVLLQFSLIERLDHIALRLGHDPSPRRRGQAQQSPGNHGHGEQLGPRSGEGVVQADNLDDLPHRLGRPLVVAQGQRGDIAIFCNKMLPFRPADIAAAPEDAAAVGDAGQFLCFAIGIGHAVLLKTIPGHDPVDLGKIDVVKRVAGNVDRRIQPVTTVAGVERRRHLLQRLRHIVQHHRSPAAAFTLVVDGRSTAP
ncbi:MAG: hypothetical protein ACD_75C02099G0001, partial [uncultured bacterium]